MQEDKPPTKGKSSFEEYKEKDIFRKNLHTLSPANADLVKTIKEKAEEISFLFHQFLPKTRELSLAQTKLEECTMWATKAIVLIDAMPKENN